MTVQSFIKPLDELAMSTVKALYMQTKDQQVFSSDDFRRLGLEQYVEGRNGIGGVFAFLVVSGLAKEVGRSKSMFSSTHGRKIGLYEWTERAHRNWGGLGKS